MNSIGNFKINSERNDEEDNINLYKKKFDEIENLKREIESYKIAIEKYDFLLKEYQTKYGDEIFKDLDEFVNQENKLDAKMLVENISLIREYEKNLLERDKNIEFLNGQLNELQNHLHTTIEENEELRQKLETKEEELNKFYKIHLNPENNLKSQSQFGLVSNYGKSEDVNMQIELLKNNNEILLKNLETTKVDLEQKKFYLVEIKEKYTKLSSDYEQVNELYQKYKNDFEDLYRTKSDFEKKIHSNVEMVIQMEKELNKINSKYLVSETEKEYLKEEFDHYKEIYDELETRKNNELEVILRDSNQCKLRETELKNKLSFLQNNYDELKFETSKLKQDNQILKYDRDNLTRQLEEYDLYVKTYKEKEKNIDSNIKAYKKKIEEANLERDKCMVRQRYLESQINKIQEDYTKIMNESNQQHENLIENSKNKFKLILDKKDEEINYLKSDNLSTKMERDKYLSEYTILKKEYDKLTSIFSEENNKCMRRFEENEKNSFKQINLLQDKYNDIVKKYENLEFEKNALELELKEIKSQDSNREKLIHKFNRNEEETDKMITKLRVSNTALLKEKEILERELERNKSMNETKIKQITEKYEMKILVLENSIKYQQDQYNSSEDKAFDVLKKQEAITNKIREEYVKTVTYYENVVDNMIKENKALKKQLDIEDNDNEPKKLSAYS